MRLAVGRASLLAESLPALGLLNQARPGFTPLGTSRKAVMAISISTTIASKAVGMAPESIITGS